MKVIANKIIIKEDFYLASWKRNKYFFPYKFLINNEEKYRRVKALLENQKGLFKIDEGEDLIVYAYIHKDHEGFIVLDGLNDLDVEVRITKNIDRKIRKSLEKISRGKFK